MECVEDGMWQVTFCAKVIDVLPYSPPAPAPAPLSGQVWVVVDEYSEGVYWDGLTDRTILVELI